ncbi:hypoxanthine phosphoribosyltransferase [Bacteriovorax sp. PP10]|uniref:Hypoxanthine phosphoribosyltransferase n=1 Tax=Bacteriovorax antarcticus TaxID=3088717 RepID=A0ABU5VXV3_9BACT|nr:hypoxanthine phosphoribosyltransferase [Bacteriovorax sp. PP10]MEA9357149.1 hypoxanthine phosphoribosyltransferase [Bacteriovorax sp. PP10]
MTQSNASIGEFISEAKIQARVKELAAMINKDYAGQEVIIVGVLNGSFIFCADLFRHLTIPCQIEFVSLSSYEGTESSGEVSFRMDVKQSLVGKNVILVEDIVDTGLTITFLLKHMKLKNLKSLKLCSLLLKRARLKVEVPVDYLGFDIEDKFVIGYGLDFDGRYRELPYIGVYGE